MKKITDNFTPDALRVLAHARRESDRLNNSYVGIEHLLLGLIDSEQGSAVDVLRKIGFQPEIVRTEIEKRASSLPERKAASKIPFTRHIKKALSLAMKEAKSLNHSYVGTGHILLGLVRESEGLSEIIREKLKSFPKPDITKVERGGRTAPSDEKNDE